MSKKSEGEKRRLRNEYTQLKFDYDALSLECEELRNKLEEQIQNRTKIEAMIDKYTPKKGK